MVAAWPQGPSPHDRTASCPPLVLALAVVATLPRGESFAESTFDRGVQEGEVSAAHHYLHDVHLADNVHVSDNDPDDHHRHQHHHDHQQHHDQHHDHH